MAASLSRKRLTLRKADEADLIARAREEAPTSEGRRAASELLGRYQRAVYVWCRRYVDDHERALDLAQEVLLSAYRGLPTSEGRSGFASWLLAIARNRCLSELRRPRMLVDEEFDLESIDAPGSSPDVSLEESMEEEELLALMHRHLTAEEQEAIWLRCFDRMPVDQITDILGVRERSGARGVLQRARRKLRVVLRERRDSTREESA